MSVLQLSMKAHNANSQLAHYFQSHSLSGVSWMIMGANLVFGILFVMNHHSGYEKTKTAGSSITFEIRKIDKPKTDTRTKPKPRPKPRSTAPKVEPLRGLDSNIAGIVIGMPDFELAGLGAVSDNLLGNMSDVVMTDDTVDIPPKVSKRISMSYPPQARKKGVTGYVLLSLLIDRSGEVKSVKLLESSPVGVFDDAAMQGIRKWKFESAVYQGEKVQVWAQQKIRFDLG